MLNKISLWLFCLLVLPLGSVFGSIHIADTFKNGDILFTGYIRHKQISYSYMARYTNQGLLRWERKFAPQSYGAEAFVLPDDTILYFSRRLTAERFSFFKFTEDGFLLWLKDVGEGDTSDMQGARAHRLEPEKFLLTFIVRDTIHSWELNAKAEVSKKHETKAKQCGYVFSYYFPVFTDDGGLALAGACEENSVTSHITKLDSNFQVQWDRFLPMTRQILAATAVKGGMVVTGVTKSASGKAKALFLSKVNLEGELIWNVPLRELNEFSEIGPLLVQGDRVIATATTSMHLNTEERRRLLIVTLDAETGKILNESKVFANLDYQALIYSIKEFDQSLYVTGTIIYPTARFFGKLQENDMLWMTTMAHSF